MHATLTRATEGQHLYRLPQASVCCINCLSLPRWLTAEIVSQPSLKFTTLQIEMFSESFLFSPRRATAAIVAPPFYKAVDKVTKEKKYGKNNRDYAEQMA